MELEDPPRVSKRKHRHDAAWLTARPREIQVSRFVHRFISREILSVEVFSTSRAFPLHILIPPDLTSRSFSLPTLQPSSLNYTLFPTTLITLSALRLTMSGQVYSYRDWLASRSKEQQPAPEEAPQPFKNHAVLHTYRVRKDGHPLPPSMPSAASTPATTATPAAPLASAPLPCYPWGYYYPQIYSHLWQYYPTYATPVQTAAAPATPQITYYPVHYPYPAPAPAAPKRAFDWYGRTKAEVKADNNYTAVHGGAYTRYGFDPPADTPNNTMFYVLEPDGKAQNVYPFGTIKTTFYPHGYWNRHQDVTYYVRNRA